MSKHSDEWPYRDGGNPSPWFVHMNHKTKNAGHSEAEPSPRNDEATKVHCSVSFRPWHFVTAVLRNENAIKVKSSTSKSLKWGLRCPKR